jgi:hypothetical protein
MVNETLSFCEFSWSLCFVKNKPQRTRWVAQAVRPVPQETIIGGKLGVEA